MIITPRVIDISHHNVVKDMKAMAAFGIWGVIHKASQGKAYLDPDYPVRRKQAAALNLLWGAYHFNTGDDVKSQISNFMSAAQPDDKTLMVLDFEDNRLSNMSVHQAVDFLHQIEVRLGHKAAIYSGNRLKETINTLSPSDRTYVLSHRLWLCQYGPRAVMPSGFSKYWLWQYTGDGVGLPPHNVPGVVAGNAGVDLNIFDGTREQLAASWSGAVNNTVA